MGKGIGLITLIAFGLELILSHHAHAQVCAPHDGLIPICGLHGSEDLEVMPDHKHLLVSESQATFNTKGEMRWLPGDLAALDLQTEKKRLLYPMGSLTSGSNDWGDRNCPGEIGDALSPHGLHLSRRDDGRLQLLVVNHGGRESIEMFEVARNEANQIMLRWRGCAVMPELSFLNDVVALPDRGFLVTHMIDYEGPQALMEGGERAVKGEDTGHVWRWRPGVGISILPNSAAGMPNGIQIDNEGRYAYLSVLSNRGEVRKYDMEREQYVGSVAVGHPDNSSWATDGRLLVAGVTDNSVFAPCMATDLRVPCGAEFHVDAVDTATMTSTTLLRHKGLPMGLATVAVQAGDFLYLGSAAGDRILKVRLADLDSRAQRD